MQQLSTILNNVSKSITRSTNSISAYYQRQVLNKHGNTYLITPRATVPMDVINNKKRFVILAIDPNDDYVVVAGKRYYLNKYNSMKCTKAVTPRIVLVDINQLKQTKAYAFDSKYARKYTLKFDSWQQLEQTAEEQWNAGGTPWVKQVAIWNKETQSCTYTYRLSFKEEAVA